MFKKLKTICLNILKEIFPCSFDKTICWYCHKPRTPDPQLNEIQATRFCSYQCYRDYYEINQFFFD